MIKLPKECYLTTSGSEQVQSESQEKWYFDKVEAGDGIFVYIRDAQFPYKCFMDSEAIFATNMVKAVFIEAIKIFSTKSFILGLILSIFSKKNRQKFVDSFNSIGWKIMSPHLLKDQYLSRFSRALHWFIFIFLFNIGIQEKSADKFATIFIHLIEYDNAYRLRLEDLFSETSKVKLQNPHKEIKRLIEINKQRDYKVVSDKFSKLARILLWAIKIPKIKKSLMIAINGMNLRDLSYDTADRYWVCIRKDYNFMGLSYEKRQEYAKDRGWTFPNSI